MIGIVGGIGSYAGIDLMKKICDHSGARTDQEHLPMALISVPHKVQDRTRYLMKEIDENPGDAIAEIIASLFASGADVIGIPCNTAHAPPIFERIAQKLPQGCQIVHLIHAVAKHITTEYPAVKRVGILATNGTYYFNVYPDVLSAYGLNVIQPSEEVQLRQVHPSIYDPEYGIKSISNPVTPEAKKNLLAAVAHLKERGAEAIVLGCTEIPLALTVDTAHGCILIDATAVLAKALIRTYHAKHAAQH